MIITLHGTSLVLEAGSGHGAILVGPARHLVPLLDTGDVDAVLLVAMECELPPSGLHKCLKWPLLDGERIPEGAARMALSVGVIMASGSNCLAIACAEGRSRSVAVAAGIINILEPGLGFDAILEHIHTEHPRACMRQEPRDTMRRVSDLMKGGR